MADNGNGVNYSFSFMAMGLTWILEKSTNWDNKVNVFEVTDMKEHTVELSILASTKDSSITWSFRCEVREKLLEFLQ